MSQIPDILEKLEGTAVYEILSTMEQAYERIEKEQQKWYKATKFLCPSGCGECCKGFEPDLFECEALYMAAWLLQNQPEVAKNAAQGIFPFDNTHFGNGKTCLFYNLNSSYHCSIYGGRAFICRLFGATSSYSKNGKKVWRPCKFYPSAILSKYNPNLEHKQYSEQETEQILGQIPPAMSDLMESALSIMPDNEKTVLLRDILPQKINHLLWLIQMNDNDNPNGSPNGSPNAPLAA